MGDQGRTLLILHDWTTKGIVPLAGPTTLSGHHLGPVFYYLLMPAYVLFPSPLAVSVWCALLGVFAVFLLYTTVRPQYGTFAAGVVSMLYAVSPVIVRQDRIIWEPNFVPLFGVLFVWLLMRQHDHVSKSVAFFQGVVCSVLIQLHYPNMFFIALLGIITIGHSLRTRSWSYIPGAMGMWLFGFVLSMGPFLYIEWGNGFRNLLGVIGVFAKGSSALGKRQWLWFSLDYAHRITGIMLPGITMYGMLALFTGWLLFVARNLTSYNVLWTAWLMLGSLAMGRYNGVVFDHYLYYLLPAPFLMLASVLSTIQAGWLRRVSHFLFIAVIVFRLTQSDVFSAGHNDISRVRSQVIKAEEMLNDTPFSFTLVGSRSYSDLHYRYVLEKNKLLPQPITSQAYDNLLIFCDGATCPEGRKLASDSAIAVLCYDHHCSGEYPKIDVKKWQFVESFIPHIYHFVRK